MKMIEYNKTRSFPFHRCMSVVRNPVFACVVTMAPESLMAGTYSILCTFLRNPTTPWQQATSLGKPMVKALLHPHMNKLGRTTFHKMVTEALDAVDPILVEGAIAAAIILGECKQTASMTDGRGIVTDCIMDPTIYDIVDKMPPELFAAKRQAVLTPHNPILMIEWNLKQAEASGNTEEITSVIISNENNCVLAPITDVLRVILPLETKTIHHKGQEWAIIPNTENITLKAFAVKVSELCKQVEAI
jgi:hypothetical protein